MFDVEVKAAAGSFNVQTTENRGHSAEELAANAVVKLISIADTTDPILKQQAEAFRSRIYHVVLGIIKQAIKSDRTTLINEFIQQGQSDTADILRRL